MNKKIALLYIVSLIVLAGKVVGTIYQGSMVVNHGSRIAELQREKQQLEKRELELQTTLAGSISIASVANSQEIKNYEPIDSPIVVIPTSAVAANL